MKGGNGRYKAGKAVTSATTAHYRPFPASYRPSSSVVVQEELVRMRPQRDRVDILHPLHLEPGVDQVLREDAAVEQERMIGLERLQRLEQASRRVLHVLPLFRLQIVQIHIHRL